MVLDIPIPSAQANHIRKLWAASWSHILEVSEDQEGDEYDRLGRNISAQERRQDLEQWVLVDRGGLEDDNMSSYGVEEDEAHPIADCMWPEYLSAMLGP